MNPAVESLLERYGLDPDHPPRVMVEAEAWVRAPGIDDPALVDLTALPFATIDEPQSRDLDQAIAVTADGDGFEVWYALADASWFIRPGTALWDEALRRGASFYLPGIVVPMLPRALSEGLCSLNPRVDRRALVFAVRLDRDGRVQQTRIMRARVHSRAKLTYDGVQAWLDGGEAPEGGRPVHDSLRRFVAVGRRRLALADERNVVRYRRAEIRVAVDGATMGFVAFSDLRNDVERYNEQISLLCNAEGARFLLDAVDEPWVQPIFRVHDPPSDERLDALARSITDIVKANRQGEPWDRQREPLASYLDRLPTGRLSRAIHRQAILSSGRATFTGHPGVHHGVGADVYARFTAPMREIVGVWVHEEAWERAAGHDLPVPDGVAGDEVLREEVIEASNRANQLQKQLDRDTNRLVLDQLFGEDMRRALGERPRRSGTVMGLDRRVAHVLLDDPQVDVKVYLRHLGPGVRVVGAVVRDKEGVRLRIGDEVAITVRGRDANADRWELGCEARR